MNMMRFVPNIITCLNLFCGCLSIVCVFNGRLDVAAYLILVAAVFDFLDGLAARLLKAYSDMGKQLDSLADVVSFGVAPASVMYILLLNTVNYQLSSINYIAPAAYLIAVFSAIRLAKFNIDVRQSDTFIGLPTPANAIFICSLVFISLGDNQLSLLTENIFFLLAVTVIFSYLLISELPLFSLKFKTFHWKSNKLRYFFVAFSITVLLILHLAGLALVILAYIVLSLFDYFLILKRKSLLSGKKINGLA